MQDTSLPAPRWTLRSLPLAARLCLSAFLISVGLGYLSALVNLHFQEATPAELLPTEEDILRVYTDKSKVSQWERLLVAHSSLPFNGQGSMRAAMTGTKTGGWNKAVNKKATALKLDRKQAEAAVQNELDGERLSLIAWVKGGAEQQSYDDDNYTRRAKKLAEQPVTAKYVNEDNSVKIKSIITDRCARCHSADVGGPGALYPLDTYDDVTHYTSAEKSTGKSLPKLAMSTHTHLLSFSMLYGLTGLILALSSCPAWVRVPVAPLALIASVVDIGFWWLARMPEPNGPMFAKLIPVTGAVLAVGLLLQIVLSLFSMFGNAGKVLLVLLFVGAGAGGYVVKERFVDPYILHEKEMMKAVEE